MFCIATLHKTLYSVVVRNSYDKVDTIDYQHPTIHQLTKLTLGDRICDDLKLEVA